MSDERVIKFRVPLQNLKGDKGFKYIEWDSKRLKFVQTAVTPCCADKICKITGEPQQYIDGENENAGEVYQDDFCEVLIENWEDEGVFRCLVIWCKYRTRFRLVEIQPYKYYEGDDGEFWNFEDVVSCKVFGNTHQYPELRQGDRQPMKDKQPVEIDKPLL